jgi:hypothetical protein
MNSTRRNDEEYGGYLKEQYSVEEEMFGRPK